MPRSTEATATAAEAATAAATEATATAAATATATASAGGHDLETAAEGQSEGEPKDGKESGFACHLAEPSKRVAGV